MPEGEQPLADSPGKFVQVVDDGRKLNDVDWVTGRILLSNKRLVLATNEGKRQIPLGKVSGVTGRNDVNQAIAKVSGYLSLQVGASVWLVSPRDVDEFEIELFSALLDQTPVLVKHPAVEGGVVRDTDWEKGRLTVDPDRANLATSAGAFVELDVDDVGTVEKSTSVVAGTERAVVAAEHTVEGTSVETHVSGSKSDVDVLATFLRRGEQHADPDVDLESEETQVLMALYTGVSPFQIPDFVGMDVEQVEEIFDRLVEKGVLETVGTRREVQLEARGRSIASDSMSDE